MIPKTLTDESRRFSAFIQSRVKDPTLVDDLLQEGFIKAIKAIETLKDEERIVPWFFQILRNVISDHYRKVSKERAVMSMAKNNIEQDQPLIANDEEISKFACDCFDFFAVGLKPEDEDIIRSLELGDERPANFAERKGISIGTLKVRRHRARKHLKEKILAVCQCMLDVGTCSKDQC